jgi:hypothetical protein
MDALIKYLVEQWAVLVTGPVVAALALGGLIGWTAAWLILKQRLDHYKERIEHFKERTTDQTSKPSASKVKKEKLQQLYLDGGALVGRKIDKESPDEPLRLLDADSVEWMNKSINWIAENMGEAAKGRFLDRSGSTAGYYIGAINRDHNALISAITDHRKNIQVLIVEFDAWNSKD